MSFTCNKCRVEFRVSPKRGESTICSAPNCGVRFWHVLPDRAWANGKHSIKAAHVGITPEDEIVLKSAGSLFI